MFITKIDILYTPTGEFSKIVYKILAIHITYLFIPCGAKKLHPFIFSITLSNHVLC